MKSLIKLLILIFFGTINILEAIKEVKKILILFIVHLDKAYGELKKKNIMKIFL